MIGWNAILVCRKKKLRGRGQACNNVLQDLERVSIASGAVNVIIQITSAYMYMYSVCREPDIVVHILKYIVGLHGHAWAEI